MTNFCKFESEGNKWKIIQAFYCQTNQVNELMHSGLLQVSVNTERIEMLMYMYHCELSFGNSFSFFFWKIMSDLSLHFKKMLLWRPYISTFLNASLSKCEREVCLIVLKAVSMFSRDVPGLDQQQQNALGNFLHEHS